MQRRILFSLTCASILGCGPSESVVTGIVTVNQQPLPRGHITFYPVAGTKGVQGAAVQDGRFTLRNMPAGQWKALITQTPELHAVRNDGGPTTLAFTASTMISPETRGNQSIVDIRSGKQSLAFVLDTQASRSP
jgi:hypothetical protein